MLPQKNYQDFMFENSFLPASAKATAVRPWMKWEGHLAVVSPKADEGGSV